MSTATKAQKCKFCEEPAAVSLIWADGRAYIPCCKAHERHARNVVASQNDSVCDVKRVEQGPIAYRESSYPVGHPAGLMQSALEPALAFVEDEEPGTYFGLRASPERALSALQEAPAQPPPRARIGRRGTPRGAVIPTHSGPDIQGVKAGQPIAKATTGRKGKGTAGEPRRVQLPSKVRQEIPDSLLQMLGTDWKNLKAYRVHDNRMTINIDGVRYSVYTRRG